MLEMTICAQSGFGFATRGHCVGTRQTTAFVQKVTTIKMCPTTDQNNTRHAQQVKGPTHHDESRGDSIHARARIMLLCLDATDRLRVARICVDAFERRAELPLQDRMCG